MPLRRLALAALALTAATTLAACNQNDNGNNTLADKSESPSQGPGPHTTGPAASPGQPGGTGAITVTAKDNEFAPKELAAKAGDISVTVKNTGQSPHTFTVKELNADSKNIDAGKTITFTISGAKAGTYKVVCTYHEAIGMTGTLTVS